MGELKYSIKRLTTFWRTTKCNRLLIWCKHMVWVQLAWTKSCFNVNITPRRTFYCLTSQHLQRLNWLKPIIADMSRIRWKVKLKRSQQKLLNIKSSTKFYSKCQMMTSLTTKKMKTKTRTQKWSTKKMVKRLLKRGVKASEKRSESSFLKPIKRSR
jgi:hypothetical protein